MAEELNIERSLKRADKALYYKYNVLKNRLLTTEYSFWGAGFPGGNDHGPQHIERVLEKLDALLGPTPLRTKSLNGYELFLTMMAILYHDVGILRSRKGHAGISQLLLEMDGNAFIFDPRDKDIISLAVVSHSSSKDIEVEAQAFAEKETIGGKSARPRVVAALVRFSDELDEDYRRADARVEQIVKPLESSRFYWRFCQRIQGIEPQPSKHDIVFYVQFEPEDVGAIVEVDGIKQSFLLAFAAKIAKINGERQVVNRFLPGELQYREIKLQVKPLKNHSRWRRPRQFTFADGTSPMEFVRAYPELLLEAADEWLEAVITSIQNDDFDKGDDYLRRLGEIRGEMSRSRQLRVLYLSACIASLRAERETSNRLARNKLVQKAMDHLKEWFKLLEDSSFEDRGDTPNNLIHKMSRDEDLKCLFTHARSQIVSMVTPSYYSALPSGWLPAKSGVPRGGGSGCVPTGTMIRTPTGDVAIEQLNAGSEILSVDVETSSIITARVVQTYRLKESQCVRLNGEYLFSPSQPLYANRTKLTRACELKVGMIMLDQDCQPQAINSIEHLRNERRYMHTLTTDHPSHNYIAYGLICANKKQLR